MNEILKKLNAEKRTWERLFDSLPEGNIGKITLYLVLDDLYGAFNLLNVGWPNKGRVAAAKTKIESVIQQVENIIGSLDQQNEQNAAQELRRRLSVLREVDGTLEAA